MSRVWSVLILMLLFACKSETVQVEKGVQHPQSDGFYSKLKQKIENDAREGNVGLGVIQYDKDEHDFGNIKEGDIVYFDFNFTNTGQGPLIVQDVETRCGCTVPEWTSKPVLPGDKGTIQVAFNGKNLEGKQSKAIVVYTNGTPYKTALVVRAFVNPKES